MSRIRNNAVFIQGNLKYKTQRTVAHSMAHMTHSRLKLTQIDSRFNAV